MACFCSIVQSLSLFVSKGVTAHVLSVIAAAGVLGRLWGVVGIVCLSRNAAADIYPGIFSLPGHILAWNSGLY